MRKLIAVGALALAASLATPEDGEAQRLQRRGYIGAGGGLGIPSGQFGTDASVGWLGHLFGGYTTRGGLWGVRLDGTVGKNSLGPGSSFWLGGGTVNAVLTPGHRPANFHPYFMAGAGPYYVNSTDGSGEVAVGLNGGAGVQLHLGHQTDIFLEGRFLTIRADRAVNLVPITVGFRWGGI